MNKMGRPRNPITAQEIADYIHLIERETGTPPSTQSVARHFNAGISFINKRKREAYRNGLLTPTKWVTTKPQLLSADDEAVLIDLIHWLNMNRIGTTDMPVPDRLNRVKGKWEVWKQAFMGREAEIVRLRMVIRELREQVAELRQYQRWAIEAGGRDGSVRDAGWIAEVDDAELA